MTKQPECFDEWKHNCAHGSKVLSVGQRSVGGRPETRRFTYLHSASTIATQQKVSIQIFQPNWIKTKNSPGNVSIGSNSRTGAGFLGSSGAGEEVASVVPVDRDVHHLIRMVLVKVST